MSTSGDEHLSHEQQYPELYDDADPMGRPCDDCGAQAGEPCRITCTAEEEDDARAATIHATLTTQTTRH